MIVVVDLATSSISLDEPDDLKGFRVSPVGDVDDVDDVDDATAVAGLLADTGTGKAASEPDHVWVAVDAVRTLAADQVDDAWAEQFDAMLAYASTKGWIDDGGMHIRAHIERT